jgi:hypothetical protein
MPSQQEYQDIKHWVKINKTIIRDVYYLFLDICNQKYDLALYDSKQLYYDMCVYFYYTLRDDYGDILFNSMREKRNYIESLKYDYRNDNDSSNNYYEDKKDFYYEENNMYDYDFDSEYFEEEEEEEYRSLSIKNKDEDKNSYKSNYNLQNQLNTDFISCPKRDLQDLENKFFNNNDPKIYHFTPK